MIRRRLVLAIGAVAAAAVLLGGWYVLVVLEDRLVDNLDADFRDGTLADDVREAVGTGRGSMMGGRDRLDPVRDVAVVVYGRAGGIDVSYPAGRVDAPAPLPDAADLQPGDGLRTVDSLETDLRYRAVALATAQGQRVVVARSMATIDQTIDDARRILLASGIAAVSAIAVLSWAVIRRAFAPIDRMVATADRIAAGDLQQRTETGDDRSEVGRLGTALDTMLDRIEEALTARASSEERMRRFVAEASHELRTPLTSVRGYAELYRQGGRDDETVATSMARIEAEANRMSRLVEDLLLLARMDRMPDVRSAPVDVGRVAAEAVDAVRVVDGERTWDLDVPAGREAVVEGDPGQLRQVLDNLLTNARLHTPPGTTVQARVTVSGERVRIEVRDDGPGIPAPERDRAFDRFWRSTRTDENPVAGTGLGLAIVRSIARAHGGEARLEAPEGGGTLAVVDLPAVAVSGEAAAPATTP